METTREIVVKLSFSRKQALLALAFLFLAWSPGYLGSESLTLTTYYPAPYGGYVSILTTGNTILARDGGNASYVRLGTGYNGNNARRSNTVKLEVGNGAISTDNSIMWGTNKSALNIDQGGSIELGGAGGTPYIDFSQTMGQDFSARLILSQANRLQVIGDFQTVPTGGSLGDLWLSNSGSIRNVCRRVYYGIGVTAYCSGVERVIGFQGDGTPRISGFLPASATTSGVGRYIVLGEDWAGYMMCCKLN